MSVAEMQACLARLYVDDAFRKLFYMDEETTLEGYKLTRKEIDAIKRIDRKMLDFFAESLKEKRKRVYRSAYSLLFKVDEAAINRYFDRYYQLYPANPYASRLDDIVHFGRFMEETLASDKDLPPYASDLAKYERVYYSTHFDPPSRETFDTSEEQSAIVTLDSRPSICEGVQTTTFRYNMVQLVAELRQDQVPNDMQQGEYTFVFQRLPTTGRLKILGINSATRDLLDLCTGNRTVRELLEAFGKSPQALGLQEAVVQAAVFQILDHLLKRHVIRV